MTMGHGAVAHQIEALEPECWGVGLPEYHQAIDIQGNIGEEMELARGIEPPTG